MPEHLYTIQQDIFALFPGYVRGIIIAMDVQNCDTPKELIDQLRMEELALRKQYKIDTLSGVKCIANWREAFRKFGAKPGEYRSSIESMARRVLRGDRLPSINALVDIGNIISLRYMMPVGGHAIDHIFGNLCLRIATGNEEFIPLGTNEIEYPQKGEVIFTDENIVLTRRWTWRQGNHTLTLPSTKSIEYNVDGLPPCELFQVEKACNELADLLGKYCGGKIKIEMLSESHPTITLA